MKLLSIKLLNLSLFLIQDGDYKNGQWDLGAQAKDNLHFPLSDLWRKPSDRINDCTYRIEKIIMNIS